MYAYVEAKSKKLADLKPWKYDRDKLCAIMEDAFSKERADCITDACNNHRGIIGDFFLDQVDDEFFIVHLPSGTMLGWYKNFGRSNVCNKNLSYAELREFFTLLRINMFGYALNEE